MLPKFSVLRPTSINDAVSNLTGVNARVHGGGTDLLGCLHDGVFDADTLVSLGGVPNLSGVASTSEGGLRIGAMTTIAEIAAHPDISASYGALSEAAAVVASPQLRNQGTIAGNICQKPRCWYYRGEFECLRKGGEKCFAYEGENQYHCIFGGELCYIVHPSDTAPALAALNAVCVVSGPTMRRTIPVDRLHVPPADDPQRETILEPNEIITEIILPAQAGGARSSYRKVRARASWDFALAGIALALRFEGNAVASARVFLSGAAPIPWRAAAVEEVIAGSRLDDSTIAAAAEAAVAEAEPLAKNGYKIPLFEGLVTDELERMRTTV
jgi:xanthine dehydrogenase YagS FAD-binding subunit